MTDASVDAQQPWLGLDSFSEDTRGFFHGREDEIAELSRRVQRKPLTVLFGQSGLGKTSILRAGLVPRLRPEGYCPVYLRVDYNADAPPPAEQLKLAVFRATQASGTWAKTGVAVDGESLWEFLHHRDDQLVDGEGRVLTPLLIFDQFEEIFTLAQADDAGRARANLFIQELADLVENRPPRALEARAEQDDALIDRFDFARCDYRVLISLREDYLAHLEALKGAMPSITQNRMRLARMTGAQALEAVIKPGGAMVTQEVAESIVRFVAGGAELRNAEVEPSLLSLICRELNATRVAQGRREISADLLAGSHATILAEFYQRALADQPPGVHRFIEEELLTESGFRENVAQERVLKAFAEAGAAPDALARLVDRRLLRVEERLDVRRVELTHDVLCGVVGAARHVRQERDARDAAEAQLAAQREREAAARAALIRARQVATVCGALAIVAVAAAAFGFWGMRQAQSARALVETARGESEQLIVYLLDDFYRELEPVGQLQIVGNLAQRALAYYDGLPAELRSAETRRNQALAQVRYGAVLRNLGRPEESGKQLAAAVTTLEALRKQGDTSEPTANGLALGLLAQSRLEEDAHKAVPLAQRAVDVLQVTTSAAGPSVALRRTTGLVWSELGNWQRLSGRYAEALPSLTTALDTWRALGLEADSHAAAQFAITSGWQSAVLQDLSRLDEALRVAETGRAAASRVLDRHPTHMLALQARALLANHEGYILSALGQIAKALAAHEASAEDWRQVLRVDPDNVVSMTNLGFAIDAAADALYKLGRPREALAKRLEPRATLEAAASRSIRWAERISASLAFAADWQAELGEAAQADRLFNDASSWWTKHVQALPADSIMARIGLPLAEANRVNVAMLNANFTQARELAKGTRERLLSVDPGQNPQLRALRDIYLRRLHLALGRVELESGNLAAAEEQMRLGVDASAAVRQTALGNRVELAGDRALWAVVLARLGRTAEAAPLAAQALAAMRDANAQLGDGQMHKVELTLALVASAWADPGRAKPLLDEAQKVFDSMPAEARSLRTSRLCASLLAQARRELR